MVTDSDTVVCGSNMLLRLAKYTVDMTRTMARLGILCRQLTNMDTISSPSSDQQPSQYKYTLNTSQPEDRTFQSSFKLTYLIVKLRQGSGKVRQGKARKGKDGER